VALAPQSQTIRMAKGVLLILACLVIAACARVEKATGANFADSVGFPATPLLGVGVRVKQVGPVSAKVYGVGLYSSKVDKAKAKGKSVTELKTVLADVVTEGTVVLKMARDVASETMASALADSVRPRLGGKDATSLAKFGTLIKEGAPNGCSKNTVLQFTCSGGSVGCSINGKSQGSVSSSSLSKALLSTYLDRNAVSPSLAEDVAKTLSSWNK